MEKHIFTKKAIRGKKLTKNELYQVKKQMTFEEHCKETSTLFGKPYKEVHRWLDEFQKAPGIGMKHRRFRHHEAGIREIIKLLGEDAGKVARQHIISDLKQEGWNERDHSFPRDEEHYVEMGLF